MRIRPLGFEFLHAGRQADGRTGRTIWRSWKSVFAIFRAPLQGVS